MFLWLNWYTCTAVRADIEIGSESGTGAINCPGTIDVTADGTYCNGELVTQGASNVGVTQTETSSVQGAGFVAATVLGSLIAAFMWKSDKRERERDDMMRYSQVFTNEMDEWKLTKFLPQSCNFLLYFEHFSKDWSINSILMRNGNIGKVGN